MLVAMVIELELLSDKLLVKTLFLREKLDYSLTVRHSNTVFE